MYSEQRAIGWRMRERNFRRYLEAIELGELVATEMLKRVAAKVQKLTNVLGSVHVVIIPMYRRADWR